MISNNSYTAFKIFLWWAFDAFCLHRFMPTFPKVKVTACFLQCRWTDSSWTRETIGGSIWWSHRWPSLLSAILLPCEETQDACKLPQALHKHNGDDWKIPVFSNKCFLKIGTHFFMYEATKYAMVLTWWTLKGL